MGLKIGAKRLQIGAKGLQIGTAFGITNWTKVGLQIEAAFEITNWGKKITNRGKDYKSGQGLQIGGEHLYVHVVLFFQGFFNKKDATFDEPLQKLKEQNRFKILMILKIYDPLSRSVGDIYSGLSNIYDG